MDPRFPSLLQKYSYNGQVSQVVCDIEQAKKCACAQEDCPKCGPLLEICNLLEKNTQEVSLKKTAFVAWIDQVLSWGVKAHHWNLVGVHLFGEIRPGDEVWMDFKDGTRQSATILEVTSHGWAIRWESEKVPQIVGIYSKSLSAEELIHWSVLSKNYGFI